jgi:hypothetical protein
MSNYSKVFETVIKTRLDDFLDAWMLTNMVYQKNSGTSAAVVSLIIAIVDSLDKKKKTAPVY